MLTVAMGLVLVPAAEQVVAEQLHHQEAQLGQELIQDQLILEAPAHLVPAVIPHRMVHWT